MDMQFQLLLLLWGEVETYTQSQTAQQYRQLFQLLCLYLKQLLPRVLGLNM